MVAKALLSSTLLFASGSLFSADVFVRPAVWWADYANGGFASKTGGSLAAAVTLGSAQDHEWSLEIARLSWSHRSTIPSPGPTPFAVTGGGHFAPVLANYRYCFGQWFANIRPYVGASVGLTKFTGQLDMPLSGVRYGGNADAWRNTLGGALGLAVPLAGNWAIDLGYRYLRIDGLTFDQPVFPGYNGPTRLGAIEAHVFSFGLAFRF